MLVFCFYGGLFFCCRLCVCMRCVFELVCRLWLSLVFFFQHKTAYEISSCLVGSEIFIRYSIDSPQKAAEAFERYGVDGVMIGRATYGRPWICLFYTYDAADDSLRLDLRGCRYRSKQHIVVCATQHTPTVTLHPPTTILIANIRRQHMTN